MGCSYPGVLLHADVDLLLGRRLNKHLVPLTSRVTAEHRCTVNEERQRFKPPLTLKMSGDSPQRGRRPQQRRLLYFSTYCSKLMCLTTVALESSTQTAQMSEEVRTKSTKVS